MTSTRTVRPTEDEAPRTETPAGAAGVVAPLLFSLLGPSLPLRFEFFDGSSVGPIEGEGTVRLRSKTAIRRLLWAPSELGLARAFVSGDIDIEGDVGAVLRALGDRVQLSPRRITARAVGPMIRAAAGLGAIGPPPSPPAEELHAFGRRHSRRRDSLVVRHHYDVGNDFYRLVLGPSLVYSCARFVDDEATLEEAQAAKLDLICRKLGLEERPNLRLLDVGSGWGSMAIHAAERYGARVVGITLSAEQAELAGERVKRAGLDDRVEIRLQDYRDISGERFDAISSIGMFEHVGTEKMGEYFADLTRLLTKQGRLLNHAISKPGAARVTPSSFIGRYVFPDAELIDVGRVVLAMERAGFEVRDVESLREHYTRTLRAWVHNLESSWEEAVAAVGEGRARVWRLYMSASANRFVDGRLSVHQVLGVRPAPAGASGMPPTRRDWE